jgi:hypothetical protein
MAAGQLRTFSELTGLNLCVHDGWVWDHNFMYAAVLLQIDVIQNPHVI